VDARLELDSLANDVSSESAALLPERLPCHASNSQAALILDEYESRDKLSLSAHAMLHSSNSQAGLILDPHPASIPRDDRWAMQLGSGRAGGGGHALGEGGVIGIGGSCGAQGVDSEVRGSIRPNVCGAEGFTVSLLRSSAGTVSHAQHATEDGMAVMPRLLTRRTLHFEHGIDECNLQRATALSPKGGGGGGGSHALGASLCQLGSEIVSARPASARLDLDSCDVYWCRGEEEEEPPPFLPPGGVGEEEARSGDERGGGKVSVKEDRVDRWRWWVPPPSRETRCAIALENSEISRRANAF
jgi:hypothetical protein